MADVKLQVCRQTDKDVPLELVQGISTCDYRGNGGEVGFDDAHRTFAEKPNADEEFVAWLCDPDKLDDVIQPGDTVGTLFNRILNEMVQKQPALLGQAASLLGLEGSGTVYARICVMDQ